MAFLSALATFMLLLMPANGLLWRSGDKTFKQLDPAHCTEAALIEPRNLPKPTTLALESAVGVPGLDFITLVHGDANMQSSRALVQNSSLLNKLAAHGQLRLLNVHVGDLGGDHKENKMPTFLEEGARYHDEYSRLVESPGFWKLMKCDRVVLMQSDSLFCHGSKARLADFAEYPYIGGHTPLIEHRNHRLHMNGGFSLRSRPAMLKCLDKSQQTFEEQVTVQEDIFYSICHSLRQPSVELMDKFAIDNAWKIPGDMPLGMHKPWGNGPFRDINLLACPGAKALYETFLEEQRSQQKQLQQQQQQRQPSSAMTRSIREKNTWNKEKADDAPQGTQINEDTPEAVEAMRDTSDVGAASGEEGTENEDEESDEDEHALDDPEMKSGTSEEETESSGSDEDSEAWSEGERIIAAGQVAP